MLHLQGHDGPIWSLVYSPDGTLLASGSADRTVRLWNVRERGEPVVLRGPLNTVTGLAFSPDGNTLASVAHDKTIRLWDVPTGLSHPLGPRQTLNLTSVAFFPDGRSVATGAGAITSVAVAPDGLVAAGSGYPMSSGRGAVKVWEVGSRAATAVLELTDMGHWSAYDPRNRQPTDLGGSIRVVKLWKLGDQRRSRPELLVRHPVAAVAFSPDGTTLAGAAGRSITVWDSATGQERAVLRGHTDFAHALAFTPDGGALISGGIDRTVRLWDVAGGRERRTYAWRTGKVYAVAVSPDGLTAAAAGTASDIIIWDLEA
jgi:WD40 repeat protein